MRQVTDARGERYIETEEEKMKMIPITKNGPYLVYGGVPLSKQKIVCNKTGKSVQWVEGEQVPVQETYALCRCGGNPDKPLLRRQPSAKVNFPPVVASYKPKTQCSFIRLKNVAIEQ